MAGVLLEALLFALFVCLFFCFCRDLAYGQIKHIDLKDVRAYSNLEKL